MISLRSSKTVEMSNGNVFQSLVAVIPSFVLRLHDDNRGCTIEALVEIVCCCQELNVTLSIDLKRLVAFVGRTDWLVVLVRCDVSCHLSTRQVGDLHDVLSYNLFFCSLAKCQVLESHKSVSNPLRAFLTSQRPEGKGKTAIDKFPEIVDGFQ